MSFADFYDLLALVDKKNTTATKPWHNMRHNLYKKKTSIELSANCKGKLLLENLLSDLMFLFNFQD